MPEWNLYTKPVTCCKGFEISFAVTGQVGIPTSLAITQTNLSKILPYKTILQISVPSVGHWTQKGGVVVMS